jgi:hypothetical protein
MRQQRHYTIFLLLTVLLFLQSGESFSSSMANRNIIYDVPNSGWTSSEWNWGYARGTGHDCAAICRQRYSQKKDRIQLVDSLIVDGKGPTNFEEIKLTLALAWQNGRWDGSDGGVGGYGDVLREMADAQRYEVGTPEVCSVRLINDMKRRYSLLKPLSEDSKAMDEINVTDNDPMTEIDFARRRCSGLVLKAMDFIESGL